MRIRKHLPLEHKSEPVPMPLVQKPLVHESKPAPMPVVHECGPEPTPLTQRSKPGSMPVLHESRPAPMPLMQKSRPVPTPVVHECRLAPMPLMQKSKPEPTPLMQRSKPALVGQVGNLRPIGNRPVGAARSLPTQNDIRPSIRQFHCRPAGRLPIGRRLPTCPTKNSASDPSPRKIDRLLTGSPAAMRPQC
jgi:hypothetical protein